MIDAEMPNQETGVFRRTSEDNYRGPLNFVEPICTTIDQSASFHDKTAVHAMPSGWSINLASRSWKEQLDLLCLLMCSMHHQAMGVPPIRLSSLLALRNGLGGRRKAAPSRVIAAGCACRPMSNVECQVWARSAVAQIPPRSTTSNACCPHNKNTVG